MPTSHLQICHAARDILLLQTLPTCSKPSLPLLGHRIANRTAVNYAIWTHRRQWQQSSKTHARFLLRPVFHGLAGSPKRKCWENRSVLPIQQHQISEGNSKHNWRKSLQTRDDNFNKHPKEVGKRLFYLSVENTNLRGQQVVLMVGSMQNKLTSSPWKLPLIKGDLNPHIMHDYSGHLTGKQ